MSKRMSTDGKSVASQHYPVSETLYFLEQSPLPLLVMERLEMSVDDLLECAPDIPLPMKLSIFPDTCSGLAYLHGMKTPSPQRPHSMKCSPRFNIFQLK